MTSPPRSVDEVTRACYARGVPAATWLSLVRQAVQVGEKGVEDAEKDLTDSLLALLTASDPPAPLLVDYLRTAVQPSNQAESPSIRPGLLAQHAATASLPSSSSAFEAVFGIVNFALYNDPKLPCFVAPTAEAVAQALPHVLEVLLPSLSAQPAPETAKWLSRFLAKPPHRLSKKSLPLDPLRHCVESLQAATARLSSSRPDLVELKTQLQVALSRLSLGETKRNSSPSSLDDTSRPLAFEPDAVLLVQHLLLHRHLHTRAVHSLVFSFLRYRISQFTSRNSTADQALARALADLLFPAIDAVRGMKRDDKAIEGFIFVKFETAIFTALQLLRSHCARGHENDSMDVDGSTSALDSALDQLVVALCQQSLVTSDVGASLATTVDRNELEPVELSEYAARLAGGDPDDLKQVFDELVSSRPAQQAIAFAIRDNFASLAASSPPDLPNLSTTCEMLVESPDFLSVLFLHIEPREVLEPVRRVLDSFDVAQDDYGDNNAVERYGVLVLFLQTAVSRFGLYSNLAYHHGSAASFFTSWVTSASATYPLAVMTDEERSAVSGWIAALFGEGISDDLMHATNPRTLLRVTPTILKQSLMACQAGVVDLDNLRDALSYFLQELLRFTLPGVLRWLIEEIGRTPPSPAQNAMLDILGVFVFSDSLPQPVLELISPDLATLLATLPPPAEPPAGATGPATPQPLDRVKLKMLIAPFKPRTSAIQWSEVDADTPQAALLSSLSLFIHSSHAPTSLPPPFSRLLTAALASSPSPSAFLRTTLLPHLLSLAISPPSAGAEDPLEPFLRLSRIERAGSALLAFSPSPSPASSLQLPPLLSAFVAQVLPASFPAWAARRLPLAGGDEQRKVELLADMLGGAVVLLPSEPEQKRVLETLAKTAVEAVEAAKRERTATGLAGEDEDEDETTALSAFFGRLLSWDDFAERCPALVDLAGGA
ncbi:hypothetical protein JCM6882_002999 [Rhodosporidiobolus microsporus]